jgi:hypothetical protein
MRTLIVEISLHFGENAGHRNLENPIYAIKKPVPGLSGCRLRHIYAIYAAGWWHRIQVAFSAALFAARELSWLAKGGVCNPLWH